MQCTLCNLPLEKKVDEFYFICDNCEAYLKDSQYYFSPDKEKKHYECHNNDINDIGYQEFTSPVTNAILERCTSDMLGLDYGCGKGPVITKQLNEKGYQINLYDPFFYPSQDYLNYNYDFIFSCEVFEHFYNPFQELTKLYNLLKTGGLLIVKTHLYTGKTDFVNWYYRKDQTHVFIYTFKTFKVISQQFGFEIEHLSERLVILRKM
ncbi:class I SAM-dependent methyltransferase [Myroides sp. LoEW2-1]|uniref:class I SAM-dependent methyltransferase n=1 Tax=Myroides sp. LoEW2-1 TaxID=2683192 RepID=UPI001322688D|nr:class I SAM-dependent methyltransferase [Myroides sp. LoEW2-1]MVX37051.1 methyltransferase domain-containing protein [Myroides sp. LoEW2-1]